MFSNSYKYHFEFGFYVMDIISVFPNIFIIFLKICECIVTFECDMGNSGTVQISLDKQEAPPLNPPIDYSDMYPPLINTTQKKDFSKQKDSAQVSSKIASSISENKRRSEMNETKSAYVGAAVDYSYTVSRLQFSFIKTVLIYFN